MTIDVSASCSDVTIVATKNVEFRANGNFGYHQKYVEDSWLYRKCLSSKNESSLNTIGNNYFTRSLFDLDNRK